MQSWTNTVSLSVSTGKNTVKAQFSEFYTDIREQLLTWNSSLFSQFCSNFWVIEWRRDYALISSLPLEGPLSQDPENTRAGWSWLLISKSGSSDNPRILYRISFTVWFLCHNKQHLGNQSLEQWRGEHRHVSDYHAGFCFCCFWFLNCLCVGKLILEAFLISFFRGKNRLKWLTAQICLESKLVAVLMEVWWGLTTLKRVCSTCLSSPVWHQAQQAQQLCPCKPSFP